MGAEVEPKIGFGEKCYDCGYDYCNKIYQLEPPPSWRGPSSGPGSSSRPTGSWWVWAPGRRVCWCGWCRGWWPWWGAFAGLSWPPSSPGRAAHTSSSRRGSGTPQHLFTSVPGVLIYLTFDCICSNLVCLWFHKCLSITLGTKGYLYRLSQKKLKMKTWCTYTRH